MARASMAEAEAIVRAIGVHALGAAAVATRGFFVDAELHVGVVVKAAFSLGPGPSRPLAAPEVDPADRAPYLPRAEVVAVLPSSKEAARLRVGREQRVSIDRVGLPISFGPLARDARRAAFPGVDVAQVDAAVATLPAGFPWAYFQRAPAEQGLDAIVGDEWISIEVAGSRMETRLPSVRAEVRLFGPTDPLRGGRPVPLRADTLWIAKGRVSILWRASWPAASVPAAGVHVVAGLSMPGQPIAWIDPSAAAPERQGTGTVDVDPRAEIARARRAVAELEAKGLLPGQRLAAPAPTEKVRPAKPAQPSRHGGTLEVPVGAAPKPATPFEAPRSPPVIANPEPPARPRHERTLEVPPELAIRPATPFVAKGTVPAPPAPEPAPRVGQAPRRPEARASGGTLNLDDASQSRAAASPATPFRSDGAAPAPTKHGDAFLAAIQARGVPAKPALAPSGRKRRA